MAQDTIFAASRRRAGWSGTNGLGRWRADLSELASRCGVTDPAEPARAALESSGGQAFASAREAVDGAAVVITMLPTGKIVRDVLLGADNLARPFRNPRS